MAAVAAAGAVADAGDDAMAAAREAEAVALRQAYTAARLLENERRLEAEIEGLEVPEPEGGGAAEPAAPASPTARNIPRALEVRVAGLGGPLCTLEADRSWTIRRVKSKVASLKQMPVCQQRLFLGSSELADEDVLSGVTPPDTPSAEFSLVRTDPEWQHAMEMVSTAGMQLAVVDPLLRADRDIVLAAVKQSGRALEYTGEALRGDRGVVLAAVQDCGLALEHAAPSLRADRDVALAAVRQSGAALQHVDDALRADRGVVLAAVASCAQAFQHAAEELRRDREFVLAVVQEAGLALQFASRPLRADRDVVVMAVQQDGLALEYGSEDLRADREVVREAVQVNGLALWDAAEKLKQDPDLLAVARWG